MPATPLKDFIRNVSAFLTRLEKNNNREWFHAHKDEYERLFLRPAQELVFLLGEQLKTIVPGLIADPKINRSIFRLNRDTRFQTDQPPYKTNLGIYFWEGKQERLETSGFYFHVEPKMLMLAVGLYRFSKKQMIRFRDTITDPAEGKEFGLIVRKLSARYSFGEKFYRKVPKGYPKDYPLSEFLLYNGLYAFHMQKDLKRLNEEDIVHYSFRIFKELVPLHRWLMQLFPGPEKF